MSARGAPQAPKEDEGHDPMDNRSSSSKSHKLNRSSSARSGESRFSDSSRKSRAKSVVHKAESSRRMMYKQQSHTLRRELSRVASMFGLAKPPRTEVYTIEDIAGAAALWDANHVSWAIREITGPTRALYYKRVFVSPDNTQECYRKEITDGIFQYRRRIVCKGVPPQALVHMVSTCSPLDGPRALAMVMARKFSMLSRVTIERLDKPTEDMAITHWRAQLMPFVKEREIVVSERIFRDVKGADDAVLILQSSTEHEAAPQTRRRVRVPLHTAQLVRAHPSLENASVLEGIYYIDLRNVPTFFEGPVMRTLGRPSNDAIYNFLPKYYQRSSANLSA